MSSATGGARHQLSERPAGALLAVGAIAVVAAAGGLSAISSTPLWLAWTGFALVLGLLVVLTTALLRPLAPGPLERARDWRRSRQRQNQQP